MVHELKHWRQCGAMQATMRNNRRWWFTRSFRSERATVILVGVVPIVSWLIALVGTALDVSRHRYRQRLMESPQSPRLHERRYIKRLLLLLLLLLLFGLVVIAREMLLENWGGDLDADGSDNRLEQRLHGTTSA